MGIHLLISNLIYGRFHYKKMLLKKKERKESVNFLHVKQGKFVLTSSIELRCSSLIIELVQLNIPYQIQNQIKLT